MFKRVLVFLLSVSLFAPTCLANDLTSWQDDLANGKTSCGKGDYAEAIRFFESALKKVDNTETKDTNKSACCSWLAYSYRTFGRYAEAESLYKRSLDLDEKFYGSDDLEIATDLNSLAELYTSQGRYAQAEPLYKRSLDIRLRKLGAEHVDVAVSLSYLAVLYHSMGRYAEAEPLYKRSLAIKEKHFGIEHLLVASSLYNLAELYRILGRYAEAEPLHKRSLAIRERAPGAENVDVAESLNSLAELYREQRRYAEAEPLYKRSLAIREKKLGLDHPTVASSLNNLALLYSSQGRYEEAERLYKRSLTIKEAKFGPDHSNVATTINNLASLYHSLGRYVEAESLYKRSLAIDENVYGSMHPEVATILNNLAELYETRGRYAEAEPLHKRALAIDEKVYGSNHPDVASDLCNLAALYGAQGRCSEAEPLYKRSLAIREKIFGPHHPNVATVLIGLALLSESQGRVVEAESMYKRALNIYEKELGAGHPDVAAALEDLEGLYDSQRRYAEAESVCKRSLAINENVYGREHLKVATDLKKLAALYEAQERYAEAEPLYRRAQAIVEDKSGAIREIDPFASAAQQQRFKVCDYLSRLSENFSSLSSIRSSDTAGGSIAGGATKQDLSRYGNVLELALIRKLQSTPLADVMKEFENLLVVRREVAGESDPQTAEVLMQIGLSSETMGGSSIRLSKEAYDPLMKFGKRLLGDTADSVIKSDAAIASGDKTVERMGGIEQARVFAAATLLCLGNMLASNAENAKAKECFKIAEGCFLAQKGLDETNRVEDLIELSSSWLNLGDYSKSEELLSKATSFAKQPVNLYKCAVSEAKLQLELADYSLALEKGRLALELGKQALTSGQILSGQTSLCNCYEILAEASSSLGRFDESSKFATDALLLTDLKKQDRAYCLVLLGGAQLELKNYEDARKNLQAALDLNDGHDKSLVLSTFTQAATLLGFTLERIGDLEGARKQFSWALGWDKTNPTSEGLLSTSRDCNGLAYLEHRLAVAKDADGDSDRARYYAIEASQRVDKYINTAFPGLSIGQQCAFLSVAKRQRDALLSVCQSKMLLGPAYTYMMKWKGLLVESLRYRGAIKVAALRAAKSSNPELARKQEELDTKIRLLALLGNKCTRDTVYGGDQSMQDRYRIETAERERLEREVSALAEVTLKDPLDGMGADSFRNLLQHDEAFVDIVSFKPFGYEGERYAAIAMKSGSKGEPALFDLGPKYDVDDAVKKWRMATTGSLAELERDVTVEEQHEDSLEHERVHAKDLAEVTTRLSNLLLSNTQLQTFLGPSVKRLWLCPEGEFGRIPWNAIATTNSSSTQVVSEVDSPREFAFLRRAQGKYSTGRTEAVLLAGLSNFGKSRLNNLPGAIREIVQLKAVADSSHRYVEYLPEEKATKESVKNKLSEVAYVHLATHGFAAGGSTAGGDDGSRGGRLTARAASGMQLPTARNPLSECGLYLALPKESKAPGHPGADDEALDVLTADEIIGLDLSKCSIVTLSACQTGLGRRLNGQGIIGLRSAIVGAGAKSVLISLWSVPDEATQELMKRFYANLWQKKMTKQESLTDAQNYIRSKSRWKHPRNWAAWVLVGE